jgi:hypothetical protein
MVDARLWHAAPSHVVFIISGGGDDVDGDDDDDDDDGNDHDFLSPSPSQLSAWEFDSDGKDPAANVFTPDTLRFYRDVLSAAYHRRNPAAADKPKAKARSNKNGKGVSQEQTTQQDKEKGGSETRKGAVQQGLTSAAEPVPSASAHAPPSPASSHAVPAGEALVGH